jgi:hypothetical protein
LSRFYVACVGTMQLLQWILLNDLFIFFIG